MSGNRARLKEWARNWVAPGFISLAQRALDLARPAPWEYMQDGWHVGTSTRGWNVASVVEMQKAKWREYAASLEGTAPLGINHESRWKQNTGNLRDHNTLLSYAYVLALAAHRKQRLSVLDWGGGIGHYYLLSKAVLPGVAFDYYCHDLPLFCEAGREVLREAHFVEKRQECFSRRYGLVLASSSVWYEQDWNSLLNQLIGVADPYLYITRMIFVDRVESYVAIQRPREAGYRTEYLCWILNRNEFLDQVRSRGMELLREFIICRGQHIHRAPEQGDYRGFLFRKRGLAVRAGADCATE